MMSAPSPAFLAVLLFLRQTTILLTSLDPATKRSKGTKAPVGRTLMLPWALCQMLVPALGIDHAVTLTLVSIRKRLLEMRSCAVTCDTTHKIPRHHAEHDKDVALTLMRGELEKYRDKRTWGGIGAEI